MSKKKKKKEYEYDFEIETPPWTADCNYLCVEFWDAQREIYRYRLQREDDQPLIPHGPKALTFDSKYIVLKAFSQLAKSLERSNPNIKLIEYSEFDDL